MTRRELLETAREYEREVLNSSWKEYDKEWTATEELNAYDTITWKELGKDYAVLSLKDSRVFSPNELAEMMVDLVADIPDFKNEILANDGFYWYVRTFYDYYIAEVIKELEESEE